MRPLSLVLAPVVALGAAAALAQEKPTYDVSGAHMGAETYRVYCASCHGKDAKGTGPLADSLRIRPPDLTLITHRNDGKYPREKIHKIIDGRESVKGHGGSDMPVWGDAFKNVREGYDDAKVKERIDQLVDYLHSIQASAPK
jgi:mono/diheme cytochrome c family protein